MRSLLQSLRPLLLVCAGLSLLPAHAQEEARNYALGPIGGQFRVTPNSSYARIVSIDAAAPGAAAGLQAGDYLFGAFGKTFTPTGTLHTGVTQELGFAVDRAEGAGGTLPLKVLRPGVGALDITVNLPAAGAFGAAYPRGSAKHQAGFESACAWLHEKAMTANGNVGYYTGWTGLCLLGHPNWNDTTGAKPYRLSINKIRDYCVSQINGGLYAAVEDKLLDGSANPNYQSGALSNWQLGQMVMFLSEYYEKTADASVIAPLQRGAEMCANTVQWWKQPALNANGYSPEGTQIAGIVSHGGVTGDYIHLGWGGGINICGAYSFNGMAFARSAGMNMAVRPRDGHYFGYPTAPAGAVAAGMENYDHTLDEKFLMQWDWMGRRCAYYSAGSPDDGHVAYTLNAPSAYDAAGRTPATLLGMSLYLRDGGTLTAAEQARLTSMKGYISRNYIRQQEAHAYCVGAQAYTAMVMPFLSDRQQRFAMDNWRFYYALSRTSSGGFQYFRARNVNDSYLDETHCAAIDMALPYVVANGGLSILPSYNADPDRVIAEFTSPDISWPSIDARKISVTGSTLAMPVNLVDANGAAVSSGYTAAWTKLSGPGTVTFSQPSSPTTNITFGTAGSYRVQLTVTRGSYTLVEPIDVSVRFHAPPAGYVAGIANYQVYTGISGTEVANLTAAAKFPNSPDITRTVTQLVGNQTGDNYGARLSGCIQAPVAGTYRFYIASDDSSQLKLSTAGSNLSGVAVAAYVTGYTSANQWNKYTSQQSAVFNLTAGQPVWFEALHKEGSGGDLLSVGWSVNGGAIEVIDGAHLSVPDDQPATMAIVSHPASAGVALGGSTTLTVVTSGPQPGFYQWRRNGVNIGAPTNSPSFVLSNVSGGAAGNYDCVYTTALGALTSNAAQVTITDAGNLVAGGLWREVYTAVPGGAVSNLTADAKFPNYADSSGPIASAASPTDFADEYGERWTGWIRPTVAGNYRFYLTSDDDSELWLSTNELPENKTRLLQLAGYTGVKSWSSRSPSGYIALAAGKSYYLEVRHKESGGGDNCAVAWQRQGDPNPANGTGEIPGEYLSYRVGGSFDDLPMSGNQPPAFVADPLSKATATVGVAYTGETLATSAGDFNSSDALVFSKISGPAWLNVAANGALAGTPQGADSGVNTFTVRVVDPAGLEDTATMNITVVVPPTNRTNSTDSDGDGFTYSLEERLGTDPNNSSSKPGTIYSGLRAWWELDENTGTNADDTTGRPQDGTLLNSPTWTSGQVGGALALNGTNQSIQIPTLGLSSNTVTLSAWVKRNGSQSSWAGIIFDRGNSASGLHFGTANELRYSWNDASATYNFNSGLTVPDNTWTFCAVVIEASKATLYVKPVGGTLQSAVNNVAHNAHNFSATAYLGQDPAGGRFFKGSLDDVHVYSRALNAAEISELYDTALPQPPVFTSDPIAKPAATEDAAYTGQTLAGSATDPNGGDTLTYSKVSGPAWLSIASNGALSGNPGNSNVGANTFTVRVTDMAGSSDDAVLNITVINTNDAPAFTVDPIAGAAGTEGSTYSGSIAGTASDIDVGDTLTYSKVSGSSWLSVAANGTLSGTPGGGTAGNNSFTVRVTDAAGASDDASLTIAVAAAPAGDGDADGDGFTNALEQTLGTNPYDNSSTPAAVYAGLQAWWKLDETSGAVADDSTGRPQDGTLLNSPLWTAGLSDGALTLNGTNQSVQVPALGLSSNTVTLSAWVKRNGTQPAWAGLIFDRSNGATGLSFGNNHELRYQWNDANGARNFNSGLTVPDNTWTFCAVVIEPTKATLYMQPLGGLMQTAVKTLAHSAHTFSASTYLGQDSQGGRFFKGSLDEVRIHSRALSAAEIGQLYTEDTPAGSNQGNPQADNNGNGILDLWETSYFGNAASGANSANEDPDHDGMSNLLEYALGTHPLEPTVSPVIQDTVDLPDGKHLRLTVQKNSAATNLIYTVQSGALLDDWSTQETTVESETANQLIVRDNLVNARRRFIRLRVEAAP